MAVNLLMAPFKGQGHFMGKVKCQRNPFLSNFYQINSTFGVKLVYDLPFSSVIFGADRL
jgi:hypothetical protein